jgi:cell division protein FtsW
MEQARRAVGRAGDTVRGVVIRRHRPDYFVLLFMGLLMLLGLVVMYAIGPQRANVLNNAYGTDYTSVYFFIKQLTSIMLALASFAVFALMPYTWLKKYAGKILMAGFGACFLLFVTGNILHIEAIAQCALGACRWFELGPLGSFQPAEFLKFGLLLFTGGFLAMRIRQGQVNDLHRTIIPLGVVVLAAAIFVIGIQKDMGTGIAMIAIIASMLMVAGINKRIGMMLVGAALLLGMIMIVIAPHRMARVATFFSGDSMRTEENRDANYHIDHAKIAIGSGGFFGVGIGNSVQATGYLPEAINDSVFAIMGETFGFVGLTVILMIFTALLMRLLKVADHLPDTWMQLVVAGVFGWLGSHVILNVAAMIGVAPLTGITLPLLSFGGTSMIFSAAALGLAFQLSKYTSHRPVKKENGNEDSSSRRGVGRPRYASRRGTTRA